MTNLTHFFYEMDTLVTDYYYYYYYYICKLPIHSEIYNCTFKNTNKFSIIIISALSTSKTYMYLGYGSLVPQHAIPPGLLLVEQGQ